MQYIYTSGRVVHTQFLDFSVMDERLAKADGDSKAEVQSAVQVEERREA